MVTVDSQAGRFVIPNDKDAIYILNYYTEQDRGELTAIHEDLMKVVCNQYPDAILIAHYEAMRGNVTMERFTFVRPGTYVLIPAMEINR